MSLSKWLGPIAWLAMIAIAVLGVQHYGATRFRAGAAATHAAVQIQQARVERAMQQERDHADARFREAVLAREAAEAAVADQRARIDGLLRQRARERAQLARTGSGPDDAGPDWIGVIGACVGEYERLGRDAAGWADQVNGLQSYIRAISR